MLLTARLGRSVPLIPSFSIVAMRPQVTIGRSILQVFDVDIARGSLQMDDTSNIFGY